MPNEKQSINAEAMSRLNDLLKTVDLSKVTAESTGEFEALKDGYYLCQVDKAQLTTSKKGNPQVALTLTVVDFGYEQIDDGNDLKIVKMEKSTKNRKVFKYYPLTDGSAVQRFATDMLKFEDEPGHSILPKEAFTDGEVMEEALSLIETLQIYINVSNTLDQDGKIVNTWVNLISWARAAKLELPVD